MEDTFVHYERIVVGKFAPNHLEVRHGSHNKNYKLLFPGKVFWYSGTTDGVICIFLISKIHDMLAVKIEMRFSFQIYTFEISTISV